MARRSFKFVTDLETNFELVSQNHAVSEKATDIKWSACFTCREDLKKKPVSSLNNNHKVEHKKQYSSIVNDIRWFENAELISVPLKNLLKIEKLEEECPSNKAVIIKDVEFNTIISTIKEQ